MVEVDKRELGVFVKLPSTQIIDLLAAASFDFAVIDLEHSQLTEADAIRLLEHADVVGFKTLVRLPEVDRGLVNRLLEAGASGIQLSTVLAASQLRELRDAMLYAPDGKRSISLSHRRAWFGRRGLSAYLVDQVEHPPQIVAQIETAETDDPLEEILNERPDVVFVGTTDLAVALGLDEQRVQARVTEIAAAAHATKVPLGGFKLDHPNVVYDVVSSDLELLANAAQSLAQAGHEAEVPGSSLET